METTFEFLGVFYEILVLLSPILVFLVGVVIGLGLLVGRLEGWSRVDSLYYAFITATTVGYGDLKPRRVASKCTAIGIALVGVVLTGIIVAAALNAVGHAFTKSV